MGIKIIPGRIKPRAGVGGVPEIFTFSVILLLISICYQKKDSASYRKESPVPGRLG